MTPIDNNKHNQAEVVDITRHLKVIGKYWLNILVFSLLVTALATLLVLSLTPVYRATATLLIESEAGNAISIEEVYGFDSTKKEYYQTQFEILRSNHIAEKVIKRLELDTLPEFTANVDKRSGLDYLRGIVADIPLLADLLPPPAKSNAESDTRRQYATLATFKKRLFIEPIRNTQLVKIHAESADPELAAAIANAIGNAYIESNLEARLVVTQTASSWINARMGGLKDELAASESNLADFLKQEGLIELDGIDELAGTELTTLTLKVAESRDRRIAAESLYSLLNQKKNKDINSLFSVSEISNHPQIRDIKNAEIDAERKVSELSKRYGPKHDKMIQAKAQLSTLRQRARKIINDLARGIEKELTSARKQEETLKAELAQKKDEYQGISSKRAQYDSLRRDVESNRQLYDIFLNRQKETSATSDFQSVNARFTDVAKTPISPAKPQTAKLVVIAAAMSLLLGTLFAFIAESYRNTIEKPDDIEEKLGLYNLGTLPRIKAKRFKNEPINHSLYFDDSHREFSESIRSIRTSLLLNQVNSGRKMLAISSSLPSEGKTTVVISLAQSLANMERTLLIDCDLRMPSVGQRFGLARSLPGLSNILVMGTDVKDCIHHHEQSGLDILPAGLVPPNPQELLGSPRFNTLIEHFKHKYDRIILDTPPLLVVSDALVLGRLAEGVILVVKAETTKLGQINQSTSQLIRHDIPNDGVILNQVSHKHTDEKYKLHYGYYNDPAEEDKLKAV